MISVHFWCQCTLMSLDEAGYIVHWYNLCFNLMHCAVYCTAYVLWSCSHFLIEIISASSDEYHWILALSSCLLFIYWSLISTNNWSYKEINYALPDISRKCFYDAHDSCHHLNHYVPLLLYNIKITPACNYYSTASLYRQDNTNHYSHTIAMLFFMLLVIPY